MNVLVIGSGGREHAIAWKFSQSPKVTQIFVAPGNPGTALLEKTKNIQIAVDSIQELLQFATKEKVDLTFVGPEKPLVLGIVDLFQNSGMQIFGPNQHSAKLESSKEYAKKVMLEANIPTASYFSFQNFDSIQKHLLKCKYPTVVKADGLAAGKGVMVCTDVDQAIGFARQIFVDQIFGDSGKSAIVEEFLIGRECSVLAISDGKIYQILASAQDHKRLLDFDEGPNTGGMGAYSPSPIFDSDLEKVVRRDVFDPIFATLKTYNNPFTGILYAGLMVTQSGPKVLEFNVRFGDPETQVILPRLESDFFDLIDHCCKQNLANFKIDWSKKASLTVVLAAPGYPNSPKTGAPILGEFPASAFFHAGTKMDQGQLTTSGGRVFNVYALGDDLAQARKHVYDRIRTLKLSHLGFEGMHYRTDIGNEG